MRRSSFSIRDKFIINGTKYDRDSFGSTKFESLSSDNDNSEDIHSESIRQNDSIREITERPRFSVFGNYGLENGDGIKKPARSCNLCPNGSWAHIPSSWLPLISTILEVVNKAILENDITQIYQLKESNKKFFTEVIQSVLAKPLSPRTSANYSKYHLKDFNSFIDESRNSLGSIKPSRNSIMVDQFTSEELYKYTHYVSYAQRKDSSLGIELLECLRTVQASTRKHLKSLALSSTFKSISDNLSRANSTDSISVKDLFKYGNTMLKEREFQELLLTKFEYDVPLSLHAKKSVSDDFDDSNYSEFNQKYNTTDSKKSDSEAEDEIPEDQPIENKIIYKKYSKLAHGSVQPSIKRKYLRSNKTILSKLDRSQTSSTESSRSIRNIKNKRGSKNKVGSKTRDEIKNNRINKEETNDKGSTKSIKEIKNGRRSKGKDQIKNARKIKDTNVKGSTKSSEQIKGAHKSKNIEETNEKDSRKIRGEIKNGRVSKSAEKNVNKRDNKSGEEGKSKNGIENTEISKSRRGIKNPSATKNKEGNKNTLTAKSRNEIKNLSTSTGRGNKPKNGTITKSKSTFSTVTTPSTKLSNASTFRENNQKIVRSTSKKLNTFGKSVSSSLDRKNVFQYIESADEPTLKNSFQKSLFPKTDELSDHLPSEKVIDKFGNESVFYENDMVGIESKNSFVHIPSLGDRKPFSCLRDCYRPKYPYFDNLIDGNYLNKNILTTVKNTSTTVKKRYLIKSKDFLVKSDKEELHRYFLKLQPKSNKYQSKFGHLYNPKIIRSVPKLVISSNLLPKLKQLNSVDLPFN